MNKTYLQQLIESADTRKLRTILQEELSISKPLYAALIRGGNLYARNVGLQGLLRVRPSNEQATVCALILVNDKSKFIPFLHIDRKAVK